MLTDRLTTESLRQLRDRASIPPDDLARIAAARASFEEALAREAHNDIARFENDLDFWLRGALVKLARASVEIGNKFFAGKLTDWAERGTPRNLRVQIVELLLEP